MDVCQFVPLPHSQRRRERDGKRERTREHAAVYREILLGKDGLGGTLPTILSYVRRKYRERIAVAFIVCISAEIVGVGLGDSARRERMGMPEIVGMGNIDF